MKMPRQDWTLGYRSKGPEGSQQTCALMFDGYVLEHMASSPKYCLEFTEDGLHMLVYPHQVGFNMTFKPASLVGELNIAWARLGYRAPDPSGKGRLNCTIGDRKTLVVYIYPWLRSVSDQPTLFAPSGRILIPHDSVGTGGVKSALFND